MYHPFSPHNLEELTYFGQTTSTIRHYKITSTVYTGKHTVYCIYVEYFTLHLYRDLGFRISLCIVFPSFPSLYMRVYAFECTSIRMYN